MNLIDRDELELDTEWSDYYDGYMSYSQSQINGAVEVQAVPLDKVKQAREEITKQFVDLQDGSEEWRSYVNETVLECVEILDKLIAESEDKE